MKGICRECGKEFDGNKGRVYCDQFCNAAYRRKQYNPRAKTKHLNAGTTGAIAELAVCQHLMMKGYEVHRAVSQASNSDLIGIKNNVVYRFEVRTGSYLKNGKVWCPKQNIKAENLIVFIFSDHSFHYSPEEFVPAYLGSPDNLSMS
ncbi:MAG TPA: hypothetical protein ENI23_17145 [bacterium]|nr:hypothetical protein [bacterium]